MTPAELDALLRALDANDWVPIVKKAAAAIRELRAQNVELYSEARANTTTMLMNVVAERDSFKAGLVEQRSYAAELFAERDSLRARVDADGAIAKGLWAKLENLEAAARDNLETVTALRAELEAAKKDAERYRWLRDSRAEVGHPMICTRAANGANTNISRFQHSDIDACVDRAIDEAPSHERR